MLKVKMLQELTTGLTFLNGKKTYIIAAIGAATAFAQFLGYTIPDFVYALEVSAFGAAIRVAIGKVPTQTAVATSAVVAPTVSQKTATAVAEATQT